MHQIRPGIGEFRKKTPRDVEIFLYFPQQNDHPLWVLVPEGKKTHKISEMKRKIIVFVLLVFLGSKPKPQSGRKLNKRKKEKQKCSYL